MNSSVASRAGSLAPEQRGGLTSRQFIRYELLPLYLEDDLWRFTYGGQPRAGA